MHAPLVIGQELAAILNRERAQLDRANANTDDCAAFYAALRSKLKVRPTGAK